jgi:hypothetical protein
MVMIAKSLKADFSVTGPLPCEPWGRLAQWAGRQVKAGASVVGSPFSLSGALL